MALATELLRAAMEDTRRLQGHGDGLVQNASTERPSFQPTQSSESGASARVDMLMSISAMAPHNDVSFEELRLREYAEQPLERLRSALAQAVEGVDEAMVQEAKTLLATKPLQTAMARREVAWLRAAIEVAEGNADVDRAVVEVSGCSIRTRTTHTYLKVGSTYAHPS